MVESTEDRISELSDDILISIISRLPFVEAAATSFLSTRWRYLYTYTFGLNFPPFKAMIKHVGKERFPSTRGRIEAQQKRFPSYVNMINRVLDSHKGDEAKKFRVHMPCWPGANVDRWLQFAFSSKVEIIDIEMSRSWTNGARGIYSLGLVNLIKAAGAPALECLKQVSLSNVGVDDGELQLLLSSTPLLESLSIEWSHVLTNVCIVDRPLHLKHLDISHAFNLKVVELGNLMNLVSFMCCGLPATYDLRIYNVPNLVELTTGVEYGDTLEQVWHRIPSCIRDQLQLLKFSMTPFTLSPDCVLPKLINVERLEVEIVRMREDFDTDGLFPLIEACCSLESLEIKFMWFLSEYSYDKIFEHEEIVERSSRRIVEREMTSTRARFDEFVAIEEFLKRGGKFDELSPERKREFCVIPKRKFTPQGIMRLSPNNMLSANLKKLKIWGYLGCISELTLSLFILKNAIALEQLIVQPFHESEEIQRMSTIRAWCHFQPVTPRSVNLVII